MDDQECMKARERPEKDYSQLENEELTRRIIGAAIKVHKTLGPGYKESIYSNALRYELEDQGLKAQTEVKVEVWYAGRLVGEHRLDLLVENTVVVELKAIEAFDEAHYSTVRSYLKATGLTTGLLINFARSRLETKRVFPHNLP